MEEAEPQEGRRLDPPLLDLSLNPTLVDAVRQLDGTGANGPRRPPAGAVRLRHAERPDSWPMPEDHPAGRPRRRDRPSAPNRLPMPNSAHCTATPVAAWRRVIASPSVALAFPFGSHASVGDLTSHLNARAASRVSWASAPKPRLPRRGLMLSENACESPAGVRLPARTGRPGSARRANPGESRPNGGFLPRMHRSTRQQGR